MEKLFEGKTMPTNTKIEDSEQKISKKVIQQLKTILRSNAENGTITMTTN